MAERPTFQRAKAFINRHDIGVYGGGGSAAFGIEQVVVAQPRDAIVPLIVSIGALGIDRFKTHTRRRVSRSGEDVFNSKEFKHVTPSPNLYADLLEENLGITFPVKPTLIELDKKNSRALALRHPGKALTAKEITAGNVAGQYYAEVNTFLTNQDAPPITSLHETMHAYIYGTNPDFIPEVDYATKKARLDIYDKVAVPNFDAEQFAAMHMCSEGLAEWAAEAVFLDIVKQRRADQKGITDLIPPGDSEEALLVTHADANNGVWVVPQPDEETYQKTAGYVRAMQDIVHGKNNRIRRMLQLDGMAAGFRNDIHASYIPGLYFADRAMRTLMERDLSRKDALDLIIMHPPVTLNEIKNPEMYVAGLPHAV